MNRERLRPDRPVSSDDVAHGADESHRLDVQGLRALAVVLVVLYHGDLGVSGGFVGVDVFLVISGFVIGRGVLRQLSISDTINLGQFYKKRVRRILPAFAVTVLATSALSVFLIGFSSQTPSGKTAMWASGLASNFYLLRNSPGYFDPSQDLNPFLHMWSLSLEEQFYLIMPLALLAIWAVCGLLIRVTRSTRRTLLIVSLGAIALASLIFTLMNPGTQFSFYMLPGRVWEFLAGLLVAALGRPRLSTSSGLLMSVAGFVMIIVSAFGLNGSSEFPGMATLLPVVGTTLLIAAGETSNPVSRVLSTNPIVKLGDMSYSWYLWHWPIIVLARHLFPSSPHIVMVAAIASLAVAWISYRFVENPVRSLPIDSTRLVTFSATVALALPALGGFVLSETPLSKVINKPPVEWELRTEARDSECHEQQGVRPQWRAGKCTFPAAQPGGFVFLVGDSHAASIADMVGAAASSEGLGMKVWTKSACQLLMSTDSADDCAEWQRAAIETVIRNKPSMVIISNKTSAGISRSESSRLKTSLLRTTDRFVAAQIPVILVMDWHEFSVSPRDTWSPVRREGISESVPKADVLKSRELLTEVYRAVESEGSITLFDPFPTLCPQDRCSNKENGTWWYYDRHHLSVPGANQLFKPFTRTLQSIGQSGSP